MSLENILKRIRESAERESEEILKNGRVKSDELRARGNERLEILKAELKREKDAIDNEVKNAVLLPAKLKIRGMELKTKQRLIERVFKDAMEIGDAEYKKLLSYLFSGLPKNISGTIYPASGREDITAKFLMENRIQAELGKPIDGIVGGFIFKAGKVEYDCSFKTLLKNLRDKFEAEITPYFMGGGK